MKYRSAFSLPSLVCLLGLFVRFEISHAEDPPMANLDQTVKQVEKLHKQGNYREAYQAALPWLHEAPSTGTQTIDPDSFTKLISLAHQSMQQLNDGAISVDEFLDKLLHAHPNNAHAFTQAAQILGYENQYGSLVDGVYRRSRFEGQRVNSRARDRILKLRWLHKASELILQDPKASASIRAWMLKNEAQHYVQYQQPWQLLALTDLDQIPELEIEEGGRGFRRGFPGWGTSSQDTGYPVDAEGKPVYFQLPESWEQAKNDGERYRFLMQRAITTDPEGSAEIQYTLAQQFSAWLDVTTLSGSSIWGRLGAPLDGAEQAESFKQSIFHLASLAENETITKFATGIKRHTLPEEFNFFSILKEVASGSSRYAPEALQSRANLFENRRQLVAATNEWQQLLDRYGKDNRWKHIAESRLQQIRGNLGKLEPSDPQPAGKNAHVSLVFRNASKVEFKAYRIDVEKLISHAKTEFRARANGKKPKNPTEWSWLNQVFGSLLMGANLDKSETSQFIVKEPSAVWSSDLTPADQHQDRLTTLTTPLQDAGIYLLEAQFKDGNVSRAIVELASMVTLTKPKKGSSSQLGFVLDATTGQPIANAKVDLFGYSRSYRNRGNRSQEHWIIREQQLKTDQTGAFEIPLKEDHERPQWVMQIQAADGRKSWLGLMHYYRHTHGEELQDWAQQKIFLVTDRPVYRPGQEVNLSAWVRRATYEDGKNGNEFAGRNYTCEIHDPRGEKIFSQQGELNENGSANLTFTLGDTAGLGGYRIQWRVNGVSQAGSLHFSVEEYKKPEFEVLVHTPSTPVQLGESFTATVEAKYYFGAPVTNAQVHYKVQRSKHTTSWFPVRPWDWLYGSGYWWRNSEYAWLPNYHRCIVYRPPWWIAPQDPPEVVAEATVAIGNDGKVQIPIDTALAKELHSDQDHRYEITAEVVDSSRRMIVGNGSVIAPRQPYQVYVWMNRGFYLAGQEAIVSITARDPQGKPVAGKAVINIMSVTYQENAGKPEEKEVARFEVSSKADQQEIQQTLQFPTSGQYRIAVDYTDVADRTIAGTATTTVRGPNFQQDSKQFRFPELEVIAEKDQYAPGEVAKLNINTNHEGATVLIFERPVQGVYAKPTVITIADGKNHVHPIQLSSKDQPNIFVEVVTVHDAKVNLQVMQIPVPPAKRIAEVELTPSQETYTPQTEGNVKIKVTNLAGEPISKGQVLLTGYDKALEYISGGKNVPAIQDFFWGWKRNHHPSNDHSLNQIGRYYDQDGLQWHPIGMFGQNFLDYFGAMPESRRSLMERGAGFIESKAAQAPASMAAPAPAKSMGMADGFANATSKDADGSSEATPMIRQEFADLLIWKADLSTDEQGIATVPFKTPDDLTTWKFRAWTLGPNHEVGEADVEIITRKNLLVRMQAPRFFVEKDEVIISGIVHNDLKEAQEVRAVLELDGQTLAPIEGVSLEQKMKIDSGKEHRFDWRVKVLQEGEAKILIKALAALESDAVEKSFPVMVHGMERQDAWSLAIRPDQAQGSLTIQVPEKRRPAQTRLEIRYSPSLAIAMVDALPFLISYPHGCTEQTLNRFVPTVITQKVLKDLGLDLKAIRDKRVNFNAQELGDAKLRAQQWQRWNDLSAVFDEAKLNQMVQAGIERLQSMQATDGGWGWWPGSAQGSMHLTAQVVEGLQIAQAAGADVPQGMIDQGLQWLQNHESTQLARLCLPKEHRNHKAQPDHGDALVHTILVSAGRGEGEMRQRLYDSRLTLSKAMQARLGLACHAVQEADRRDMIIRNLEQFQKTDEQNQTAWLDFGNQHHWWYWYDDEIETLAAYLRLRITRDGQDPVAPGLVKYLLNHRKNGTYWRSTRDTAAALTAMATYLQQSKENDIDMLVEVWIDGRKLKEAPINKDNLFSFDHGVVIRGAELSSGEHRIELKRKGKGTLYANAYLTCFTLEDHLRSAGLEVQVQRKLSRLIAEDTKDLVAGDRGQALQQKGQKYRREALADDAQVNSGDLIEVELLIESKNDYEYLILEDFKPAGCEAMELRSGYVQSQGLNPYREFRDEKVSHYLEHLPRGKHTLTYQLRAEIPGKFHALPSVISGMYAPELKGNAEEIRIHIADKTD